MKYTVTSLVFLFTMFIGWGAIEEHLGHIHHTIRHGEDLHMERQIVLVFVMSFVGLLVCLHNIIKEGKEHQQKLGDRANLRCQEYARQYELAERQREAWYRQPLPDTSKMRQFEAKGYIEDLSNNPYHLGDLTWKHLNSAQHVKQDVKQ